MRAQGFLEPTGTPDVYKQRPIEFLGLNDRRRLEIRRNHARFLEIAKHRLNDDLAEREFQGLTLAIPASKFEQVKTKMRELIAELRSDLADHSGIDTVIRVQCCAYKITKTTLWAPTVMP